MRVHISSYSEAMDCVRVMQRGTPGPLFEGEDPRKIRIITDSKVPTRGGIFLGDKAYRDLLQEIKAGGFDLEGWRVGVELPTSEVATEEHTQFLR